MGISCENIVAAEVDYSLVLHRWKKLFPNSKILIICRRQDELLYSWYGQLVNAGYFRTYSQFAEQSVWNMQQSIFGRMHFDRVFEISKQYFDNVKVVPFELLKWNFDEFKHELDIFFQKETYLENTVVRPTPSAAVVNVFRIMNTIWRHGLGQPTFSIQPDYVVGPNRYLANQIEAVIRSNKKRSYIRRWANRIGNRVEKKAEGFSENIAAVNNKIPFDRYFGESNIRLEALTGVDIAQFDYPGTNKN